FSDDINWCKKHFIGNQFDFFEGSKDIQDFSAMIACSGNIIANSSFSWWSAWLNKKPGNKVIAPAIWFG
ncbi:MAG: alpha-1,2-fucosyltransferase, partial [Candidatus Dadabacteria bacterium]|nr:alpha-1,2-fucosyltransferase [Candidatus Dadabacteria bacterium]